MERCAWCLGDEKMIRYHDAEWGRPLWDDRKHFAFLMLEVMQCGLSWKTVLDKRAAITRCFAGFDPAAVAALGEKEVAEILRTPGMIRSPRKVAAVIHNAGCFLDIQRTEGSYSRFLWEMCGGRPIVYAGHDQGRLPAQNALSQRVCAALRQRGMRFLGPVTVYAYLQSCGVINDHHAACACGQEIRQGHPFRLLPPEGDIFP